jgi:hypothetical protein
MEAAVEEKNSYVFIEFCQVPFVGENFAFPPVVYESACFPHSLPCVVNFFFLIYQSRD